MELTIHIGPHKTGTTAIQAAFSKSAKTLRREGLLYPKHHWRQQAHHGLAFALKGKRDSSGRSPDFDTELNRVRAALDRFQGPKALISSEELFTCPPEGLERLRKALPFDVRVICFLRRPDDFLISCYNQKTKQPGNKFAVPFARFLTDPHKIAPEFDFATAVLAWADVFGDAAVHVKTYETASPLEQLKRHLGLGAFPKAPNQPLNASVPGVVAEIMRHAKAFGLSDAKQRRLSARAQSIFATYPALYVSNEDRCKIIASVESDLNRLFARFGKKNPYTVNAFQPVEHAREHNLTMQDVMHLIDDMM